MKKILLVYPEIMIGGSTTSLLSLLSLLDYKKYKVDLLLYRNQGELLHLVPSEVNILPEAEIEISFMTKVFSINYFLKRLRTLLYKSHLNYNTVYSQIMSYGKANILSRKLNEEYDVAISFLEFWSNAYVAYQVKAKIKIGWIHPNYIDAGFIKEIDFKAFQNYDYIVAVSEKCKQSLMMSFPTLSSKVVLIENILSSDYVKKLADNETTFKLDKVHISLVTVCRLTNSSKGLDRGIEALAQLKKEGYNFNWYIIGDGPDRDRIKLQIQESSCEKNIHLLGKMNNPLPVVKQADIFFLPSRYEGKPMAITEAQMLNVPAIVTEYSSAKEQIAENVEGVIVLNNDQAIFEGLKYIISNSQIINKFKQNLSLVDKSNLSEIDKFYRLIESNY